MEAQRPGPKVEAPRCPYCHAEVAAGEAQLACNGCRAWHHQACWAEGGARCAACGQAETGLGASRAPPVRAGPVRYRTRSGRTYTYGLPVGTWLAAKAAILLMAFLAIAALAELGRGRPVLVGVGVPLLIAVAAIGLRRFEAASRRYEE